MTRPEVETQVEQPDALYDTLAPTTLFVPTRRAPELGSRVRVRVTHQGSDLLVVDGDVQWVYPVRALPPRRRAGFGLVIERVEQGYSAAMQQYSQRTLESYAEPPGARLLPFHLTTKSASWSDSSAGGEPVTSLPPVAPPPGTAAHAKRAPRALPEVDALEVEAVLPGLRAVAYTVFPEEDEVPDTGVRTLQWPHALDTPTVEIAMSPASISVPPVATVTGNSARIAAMDAPQATPIADEPAVAEAAPGRPSPLLVDPDIEGSARALELLADDLDDEETEIDNRHRPLEPMANADAEDDEDPSLTIPGFNLEDDKTLVDIPSSESLIPTDTPEEPEAVAQADGPLLPETVWLGIYGREPLRLFETGRPLPADARYQLLLPETGDIELRFFEGEDEANLKRVGVARWSRRVFEQDAQLIFAVQDDGTLSAHHDEASTPQRFALSWGDAAVGNPGQGLLSAIRKKLFGR